MTLPTSVPAYSYLPDSGAFNGVTSAYESPLEPGVFLLPAHTTNTVPPDMGKGQVAVWRDSEWTLVADYRGQVVYDVKTKAPSRWLEVGDLPATVTLLEPTDPTMVWQGGVWVTPPVTLEQAKASKLAQVKAAYRKALDTLNGTYTPQEIATWPQQIGEAAAYKSDAFAITPALDAIAKTRDIDKAELADRILKKNQDYHRAFWPLVAAMQAGEIAVYNAATVEEVAAI